MALICEVSRSTIDTGRTASVSSNTRGARGACMVAWIAVLALPTFFWAQAAQAESWLDLGRKVFEDTVRKGAGGMIGNPAPQKPQQMPPQSPQHPTPPASGQLPAGQPDFNQDRVMVRDAQRMLNELGFDAGQPDGVYGKRTRGAIRAFQHSRGQPATGDVTPPLLVDLSNARARIAGTKTAPGGGTAHPAAGNVAANPSGGLIAPPPGGGLVAPPPPAAIPAPNAPVAQGPASTANPPAAGASALAQKFGLHTAQGRPAIPSPHASYENILTEQQSERLTRFFTLMALKLAPNVGEKGAGGTDHALCLANLFLTKEQKNEVLDAKEWKGAGRNEFEARRARDRFLNAFLPQLVAGAPALPIEFVYITRVFIDQYDRQRGGFPIAGMPENNIDLPNPGCLDAFRVFPIASPLPNFWALDPAAAEQVLRRIPRDPHNNNRSKAFSATVFTLSAASAAKLNDKYGRNSTTPLTVTVKSIGLYEDKDLERHLHTFEFDAPAPPVLLAGVPANPPVPQQVIMNEETVALLLLKQRGDILDRDAWEALARLQMENDKAYYAREKTRKIGSSYRTTTLKTFDPTYIPFFPNGFRFDHSTGITDEQLATFKQWTLKRAAALPNRFVLYGEATRDEKSGGIGLDFGTPSADRSRLSTALVDKGYVPGQIVRPDLDRLNTNSTFDRRLTAGQGKSHMPVLVFSNLLKAFAPGMAATEGRKLFGASFDSKWWRTDAELDMVVQRTELLAVDDKTESFVLHVQPVAVRILNNKAVAVYKQDYQVAALDPTRASAAALAVAAPSRKTMPFSAETADLLLAKFLPETLDQAAIERMMLARWYYESTWKGAPKEPVWGRFFVEGKPKPDDKQRAALAARFKDWTLKRAQAMPDTVTVVFRYAQIHQAGLLELGNGLYSNKSTTPIRMEVQSCQSRAAGRRQTGAATAGKLEGACAFLKDAAAIPLREIYIGSAETLARQYRSRFGFSRGAQGVGPRMNCHRAVYDQDGYCTGMQAALREELVGQEPQLDDVLVIDKEIVVPADRPDITRRSGANYAVELDVAIAGIRRANRLPPPPYLAAYERYREFTQEPGQGSGGTGWTARFEEETVDLFLFDARVQEARIVDEKSRKTVAKLLLREPRSPNPALLKEPEPERVAVPDKFWGPDIVGLRLGMTFDAADEIIRKNMKVGRVLVANRTWQTDAATGNIKAYTSGRLYESEDGSELIILHDEPPAAPSVVLGIVRQLAFPKGKVPPAAIFAQLEEKYGKPTKSRDTGQIWTFDDRTAQSEIYHCVPSDNEAAAPNIWRQQDGSAANWDPSTLRYRGRTPGLSTLGLGDARIMPQCRAGLSATFDTRQNSQWDRLVLRAFDQRTYSRLFDESKRRIAKGERGTTAAEVSAGAGASAGVDIKF